MKKCTIEYNIEFEAPDDFDSQRLADQINSRILRLVKIGLMELEGSIEPGSDPFFDQHCRLSQLMDLGAPHSRPAADEMVSIAPMVAAYLRERYPDEPLGTNPGFLRLAIDAEASGDLRRAIELCQEAMDQGWDGDWPKRMNRYMSAWRKSGSV